jgi:CheY-like chemotaxis protein
LLDLMLPHMDGIEFRMAQRSSPAITDIPVIVITAFDIDPRLKEELQLAEVFRKPLDVPGLLGAMSAAIAAAA